MSIGIMQGRLLPPIDGRIQCFPRNGWRREFALAATAGIDAIEWIYDLYGADVNPVATDTGLAEIRSLSAEHGTVVRSVCADYFMDRPLLRNTREEAAERLETLVWLLERCAMLSVSRVVLPFVDASRIDSDAELDQAADVLDRLIPTLNTMDVELHLETSLAPGPFAALLQRLPTGKVKVNYDSGNSASLGYSPREEFAAYGPRVGSVHIKDRVLGGTTVPLGTGDADFSALFDCLQAVDYRADFVLQVARGEPGNEVSWATQNREYVQALQAAHA